LLRQWLLFETLRERPPQASPLTKQHSNITQTTQEIHLELAKALEKEQKWEDALAKRVRSAIASYRRATKLNPDYSWSHKHLGDTLAVMRSA